MQTGPWEVSTGRRVVPPHPPLLWHSQETVPQQGGWGRGIMSIHHGATPPGMAGRLNVGRANGEPNPDTNTGFTLNRM